VKIENTKMRPVLAINRPVLPINWCSEFRTVFAGNRSIFVEIR
jgi:hypothetical protein